MGEPLMTATFQSSRVRLLSDFSPRTWSLKGFSRIPESFPIVVGYTPTAKIVTLLGEFLYNMGGSIIRISRPDRSGRFAVASDPKIGAFTLSGLGINSQRSDAYQTVTSWGDKATKKETKTT